MAGQNDELHLHDHQELKSLLGGWAVQPGEDNTTPKQVKGAHKQASDLIRDNLLLHLGAYHGWTVAKDGGNIGLTPCLSAHDVMHGQDDLLGVEVILPKNVRQAIAQYRDQMRTPPA